MSVVTLSLDEAWPDWAEILTLPVVLFTLDEAWLTQALPSCSLTEQLALLED